MSLGRVQQVIVICWGVAEPYGDAWDSLWHALPEVAHKQLYDRYGVLFATYGLVISTRRYLTVAASELVIPFNGGPLPLRNLRVPLDWTRNLRAACQHLAIRKAQPSWHLVPDYRPAPA